MLAELPEDGATGEIAEIYNEIRRLWAVPYVSSLQRNLATKLGWLEWTWAALGPAFLSGSAQSAGWEITANLPLPKSPQDWPSLPYLGKEELEVVGIVCESFVRVAPVNLIFAGLLGRLLIERTTFGTGWPSSTWSPPETLPSLPPMVDITAIPSDLRVKLINLGTNEGGEPFVPGLYRILAKWPDIIDYLDTTLPRLKDLPETEVARMVLLMKIDAAVDKIFTKLPPLSSAEIPSPHLTNEVLSTLAIYRRTSPEMVIFGRYIAAVVDGKS